MIFKKQEQACVELAGRVARLGRTGGMVDWREFIRDQPTHRFLSDKTEKHDYSLCLETEENPKLSDGRHDQDLHARRRVFFRRLFCQLAAGFVSSCFLHVL